MMSYADSSDPMPPGPDFLANPPLQQRDQPQGPPPAPTPAPYVALPQNMAPPWQTSSLYGAATQPGGPKRPGPATAAAVLGIISGSLGLFPAIIVLLATAKVYETENAVRSTNIAFIILLILALATAFAVITLLVAGITFLTGRGYTVLLSAVITQLTLTVLYAVIMLLALDSIFQNMRNRSSGSGAVVIIMFCILIGLGLAVSNLVLLRRPATRQWARHISQHRRPVHPDDYPFPVSNRRLMLVHAHPDDESSQSPATMSRYVAEGAQVTLVTCTQGSGHNRANTLFDRDGMVTTIDWQHLAGPFVGAGTTLSGALAALMAQGLDAPEALAAAQEFTYGALRHARRFGMGKLVPNRFHRTQFALGRQ